MSLDGFSHVGRFRGTAKIHDGLTSGEVYEVAVVPRSRSGLALDARDGTRSLIYIQGRRERPANVANFTGSVLDGVLHLRWDAVTDKSVSHYEIRSGTAWLGAWKVGVVDGTSFAFPVWWLGSQTLWIKAISRTCVESDVASSVAVESDYDDWSLVGLSIESLAFGGTKTGMTISGANLELTSTSGTYETSAVSVATVRRHRVMVLLTTDVEPLDATCDRMLMACDGAYSQRRTCDATTMDGSEVWRMPLCSESYGPCDGLYAQAECNEIVDPTNWYGWTIEVATSTDGGATWGNWTRDYFQIVSCNAVKARITGTTRTTLMVPRITGLAFGLIDGVIDGEGEIRTMANEGPVVDANTGTYAGAHPGVSNAADRDGLTPIVNFADSQTVSVAVSATVPPDLAVGRAVQLYTYWRLSGSPSAGHKVDIDWTFRAVADNEVEDSGGLLVSGFSNPTIDSYATTDLLVISHGDAFSASTLAIGDHVKGSITRDAKVANASDTYTGTLQYAGATFRYLRVKRWT